jgi:hypothetical protein
MKYLVLFFCCPILVFGQQKEISIGVHSFNLRTTISDTITGYQQKGSYLTNFSNGIGFTYFIRPQKYIEASIGFAPLHSSLRYSHKIVENGNNYLRVNTTNQTNYSTYSFIGYGITQQFSKVQWRSAIKLSIQHLDIGTFTRNEEVFDSVGNIISYRRNTSTDGYYTNIGAYMVNSFVLPIYKKILFSADLNIGYHNDNYYGVHTEEYNEKKTNNTYSNINRKYNYKKNTVYYFNYYPSISIRYAFGK